MKAYTCQITREDQYLVRKAAERLHVTASEVYRRCCEMAYTTPQEPRTKEKAKRKALVDVGFMASLYDMDKWKMGARKRGMSFGHWFRECAIPLCVTPLLPALPFAIVDEDTEPPEPNNPNIYRPYMERRPSSYLVRCNMWQRIQWENAARSLGKSLPKWIRETLDASAEYYLKQDER